MMTIFKGDDTGGTFGKSLTLTITSPFSLSGCKIIFNLCGYTRTFENITSGDTVSLFFSHNDTMAMPVGVHKAVILAIDAAGKIRTIENSLAVKVTTNIAECYGTSSSAVVVVGTPVKWSQLTELPFEGKTVDISTDDKVLAALGTIIEKLGGSIQ